MKQIEDALKGFGNVREQMTDALNSMPEEQRKQFFEILGNIDNAIAKKDINLLIKEQDKINDIIKQYGSNI